MDLDALWDFGDPAGSEQRFRAALADAVGEDAAVLRTQLARALALQRQFAEAEAMLSTVQPGDSALAAGTWTSNAAGYGIPAETPTPPVRALSAPCSAPRRRAWISLPPMPRTCSPSPRPAKRRSPGPSWRCGLPRRPAIRAPAGGPVRSPIISAGPCTTSIDTTTRCGTSSKRWRCGRSRATRTSSRWRAGPSPRCLRSLGRYDEALAIQRELRQSGPGDGYIDEELGELLLVTGHPQAAAPHFAAAHRLLSTDPWLAAEQPERLHRLAELAAEHQA